MLACTESQTCRLKTHKHKWRYALPYQMEICQHSHQGGKKSQTLQQQLREEGQPRETPGRRPPRTRSGSRPDEPGPLQAPPLRKSSSGARAGSPAGGAAPVPSPARLSAAPSGATPAPAAGSGPSGAARVESADKGVPLLADPASEEPRREGEREARSGVPGGRVAQSRSPLARCAGKKRGRLPRAAGRSCLWREVTVRAWADCLSLPPPTQTRASLGTAWGRTGRGSRQRRKGA